MKEANSTLLARFAAALSIMCLVGLVVVGTHKSSGSAATSVSSGPVTVSLTEYAITPGTIKVPQGGSVTVTNNGTMAHNLTIKSTSAKIADLAPGASADLDLSALPPGTYEAFCSVSGHEDLGMKATLTIVAGDAGATAMGDMSGMDTTATTAPMDISAMDPSSPEAEAMNKKMEEAMTGGVTKFLDYAKQYGDGTLTSGNQKLTPKIEADGTKHFYLQTDITDWEVSPGKVVKAWTYNGMVPGPWIRVEPNDKVKITVTNGLPISTDIHLHGVDTPNNMDGVAPITQHYIEPFHSFTYAFTASPHQELGMYHAHMHGQVAIPNGLFAIFQVGDMPLPRGVTVGDVTIPQNVKVSQEIPMVLNDAGVIGLSINGKAFPETAPIVAKKGDWILLDFFNEGLQGHPMHLHRQPQIVIAKDGFPLLAPYRVDTLWIAPGERYSVLVKAEEVGTWAFHCHIVSHAEDDNGLFGMVTAMIVQP